MAKKAKPKGIPVTADTIGKAAQTGTIKDLVKLADAFYRAGVHGPFAVALPIFCPMHIPGKGYRRGNVTLGQRFNTDKVSLGKSQGLIFSFTPQDPMDRNGEAVERIEIGWDDVINNFENIADLIQARMDGRDVTEMNTALKEAIARNPSMHKILSEGFALAQIQSKQTASTEVLEEMPGWGSF